MLETELMFFRVIPGILMSFMFHQEACFRKRMFAEFRRTLNSSGQRVNGVQRGDMFRFGRLISSRQSLSPMEEIGFR